MTVPVTEVPQGPKRLAELVTREDLQALLFHRPPKVLEDPNKWHQAQQIIAGTATEVARIVGDPPPADIAKAAAWVVALGAASALESSLFPEQQNLGDDGRAGELRIHYLRERNLLQQRGVDGQTVSGPQGSFPPPAAWPVSTVEPLRVPWAWQGWEGWRP